MSATHVAFWDYDRKATVTCGRCGWSGPAAENEEFYEALLDVTCPQCSQMLLIVSFPTPEETRAAGAAGNSRAQAEIPLVNSIEQRWKTARETGLADPAQLPEIADEDITIAWDFEERDGESFTVLRHENREIWRELAFWEGIGRFVEVTAILEQRYGDRLAAVEPTARSEVWLYGDRLSAPERVTGINARLARCRPRPSP